MLSNCVSKASHPASFTLQCNHCDSPVTLTFPGRGKHRSQSAPVEKKKMLKDYPLAAFHAMIALMAKIESWSSSFKRGSGWRSCWHDLSSVFWGIKPIQSQFPSWLTRPLKLVTAGGNERFSALTFIMGLTGMRYEYSSSVTLVHKVQTPCFIQVCQVICCVICILPGIWIITVRAITQKQWNTRHSWCVCYRIKITFVQPVHGPCHSSTPEVKCEHCGTTCTNALIKNKTNYMVYLNYSKNDLD